MYTNLNFKHLDTGKATGIDNVSAKYFKMSAVIVAPILVHIYSTAVSNQIMFQHYLKQLKLCLYTKRETNLLCQIIDLFQFCL